MILTWEKVTVAIGKRAYYLDNQMKIDSTTTVFKRCLNTSLLCTFKERKERKKKYGSND